MERTKRPQIPSFGDWNYYNELPITQYFESAMQAGLVRSSHCSEEEDAAAAFYLAASSPVKPIQRQRRSKERRTVAQKQKMKVAIKPIDEDLYKIPPELMKKPKRNFFRNLFTGCLGLNCIA